MKVVLIASGGLDSTVLYHFMKDAGHEVTALNFRYGSRHNKVERASLVKAIPDATLLDIDLSFLHSSLLENGEAVPHGHYQEENMKSTVVPFRNGILLAYAIAVAEDLKADAVALGSHAGDHAIYPDCRAEFTQAIDQAAFYGTYRQVRVVSPFNHLTKGEIAAIGRDLGIVPTMMQTWSCYEGVDTHCGKCGACTERKEAFAFAGVEDTTIYKE